MIRAAIIDDEPLSIETLTNLIAVYCPEIQVIATADSVMAGRTILEEHQPELVFLDIAMPDGDGFEVLEQVDDKKFEVIFTTAYEEYAVKAFDFSAMNYLLKPISSEDLRKVVLQFHQRNEQLIRNQQFAILQETLKHQFQRIALPTFQGIEFVDLQDILYCVAEGGYTNFLLKDGQRILVSRSLGQYEELLQGTLFFRIHHKYLVNLQYLQRYVKGAGGYVVMENGDHLDVSVRKKEKFMRVISKLTGL